MNLVVVIRQGVRQTHALRDRIATVLKRRRQQQEKKHTWKGVGAPSHSLHFIGAGRVAAMCLSRNRTIHSSHLQSLAN
jgi:hypothetical protein